MAIHDKWSCLISPSSVDSEKIENFYFREIDAHGYFFMYVFFSLWPLALEFHAMVTTNTLVAPRHQHGAEAVVFKKFICSL